MTKLRTFVLGIGATFGLPWLFLIVIPFFELRAIPPVDYDFDKDGRSGSYPGNHTDLDGVSVYASEGCAYCHTQVIRPVQVTLDGWRLGWGQDQQGKPEEPTRPTRPEDYQGESYAHLGIMRTAPDLANVGYRYDRLGFFKLLYDPRAPQSWSSMPAYRHLFNKQPLQGEPSADAVEVNEEEGYQVVPSPKARALVDYLMSLKRDLPIPAALASGRPD